MSFLGDLPSFNGSRSKASPGSARGFDSTLDLDSLLGDSPKDSLNVDLASSKAGGVGGGRRADRSDQRRSFQNNGRHTDSNFYSNIAMGSIEEEMETDPIVTEEDTKRIAEGVKDLDHMEASLFGALNRKPPTGVSRRSSQSSIADKVTSIPSKKKSTSASSLEGEDEQEQALLAELSKGLSYTTATSTAQKTRTKRDELPESSHKKTHRDSFDLDDLLGGLDDSSSTRGQKANAPDSFSLSPTTRHREGDGPGGAKEGGKTRSRVDSDLFDRLDSQKRQPAASNNSVDILKMDSSPVQATSERSQPSIPSAKRQNSLEESFDDDDILADLGLDDSLSVKKKIAPSRTTQKSTGSTSDLFGVQNQQQNSIQSLRGEEGRLHMQSADSEGRDLESQKKGSRKESVEDDQDSFQFGGYMPTTSGTPRHKSSVRSTTSEDTVDDLFTSRPSSAPVKKAVRFNDNTQPGDPPRPATSPLKLDSAESESNRGGEQTQTEQLKQRQRSASEVSILDTSAHTRPPTGRGVRRESSPAMLKMFSSQPSGQEAPQPSTKEEDSTSNEPLFPWQNRNRTKSSSGASRIEKVEPSTPSQDLPSPVPLPTRTAPAAEAPVGLAQPRASSAEVQQLQAELQKHQEGLKQVGLDKAALQLQLDSKEKDLLKLADLEKIISSLESELSEQKKAHSTVTAELLAGRDQVRRQCDRVAELENTMKQGEDIRKKALDEREEMKAILASAEQSQREKLANLQNELDSLKLKHHQSELERAHLQQTVDGLRQQHGAEVGTIESSYSARLKTLQESYQKQEARWREERDEESSHYSLRLKQSEKDKYDTIADYKRRLESVELTKSNELERVREVHSVALADLKREHELDVQHGKTLHLQEVEALKASHAHSRTLAELSHQVEYSAKEFSRLQERLEQNYKREVVEREDALKMREENLKVQEERICKQQFENDKERGRLQGLIVKMEANLAEQTRQLDKERWNLQQEWGRLHAQKSAFEEERETSMRRADQDREDLQKAKDDFLKEQKQIHAQCHEERKQLSLERAQFNVDQKNVAARKREQANKNVDVQAELQTAMSSVQEEAKRLTSDLSKARSEREDLVREKAKLQVERERVELISTGLERRAAQVDQLSKTAHQTKQEGEGALVSAQNAQRLAEEQLKAAHAHETSIRDSQKQLNAERLALVDERRELTRIRQTGVCHNCSRSSLPPLPPHTRSYAGREHRSRHYHSHSGPQSKRPSRPHSPGSWSPPPVSVEDLESEGSSVDPAGDSQLDQLRFDLSMRQLSRVLKEDNQALESEDRFLKQLAYGQTLHAHR